MLIKKDENGNQQFYIFNCNNKLNILIKNSIFDNGTDSIKCMLKGLDSVIYETKVFFDRKRASINADIFFSYFPGNIKYDKYGNYDLNTMRTYYNLKDRKMLGFNPAVFLYLNDIESAYFVIYYDN